MIPEFKSFFNPTLEFFNDGDTHAKKEVSLFNAKYFDLSEDDLKETTSKGSSLKYKNRSEWAVTYLYHAGLLERKKRGMYTITDEGKKILNQKSTIDIKFLEQYESFRLYKNGKNNKQQEGSEIEIKPEDKENSLSPTERLENAHNEINDELSNTILNEIMNNTPDFFERLVVDLLINMGYGGSRQEAGQAVGKVGDEGIDGIIKEDRLGLDNIYIQAKRFKKGNNVDGNALRSFSGALDTKKSNKGVFITTSDFTPGARKHVKESSKHIALINGDELTELMIKFNVGVSIKDTYEIKELDMDYFEN